MIGKYDSIKTKPQPRQNLNNEPMAESKQSDKSTVAGSEVAMCEVNGPMQSSAAAGDARKTSAAEKSMKQQLKNNPMAESKQSDKGTVAGSEVAMGEVNGPMQSSAAGGNARKTPASEKPMAESKSSGPHPESNASVTNTCSNLPIEIAANYIIPAVNSAAALARLAQVSSRFKKLATDTAANRSQRLRQFISNSVIAGIQLPNGPLGIIEELSRLERIETAIKVLTENNITDIHALSENRYTQLHIAVKNKNPELVQALLNTGADHSKRDSQWWTPLEEAIRAGHTKIVNILIAAGANVNLKREDGVTPLNIATRYSNIPIEIIKALVDAEADPYARDNKGNSPEKWAYRTANETHDTKILDFLHKAVPPVSSAAYLSKGESKGE